MAARFIKKHHRRVKPADVNIDLTGDEIEGSDSCYLMAGQTAGVNAKRLLIVP